MIWTYELLAQFKNSRLGDLIITFDDLKKERYFEDGDGELQCWIAHKNKKDYVLLNDDIKNLPIKIIDTIPINENKAVYHFIKKFSQIGFKAEKSYDFRELVNKFFDVKHSNPSHFTLFKIIAFASYITRINLRICSNPEFGKDSTFEVLNYLTNTIAVFDKPKTMAKLEYGLVNRVLMVNELVPKTSEEKQNIMDFLLPVGSLKPIYQKKSRGSAAHSTKDSYDITNLSLVICYNSMEDIAKVDRENYFDFVFGRNVTERFVPFKLNGRLDLEQFNVRQQLSLEDDKELLKIARTIEWYRINYVEELKPFKADLNGINLSGRQRYTLNKLCEFIGLYSKDEGEFKQLVNLLIQCHYNYNSMLKGNKLVSQFEEKIGFSNDKEDFKELKPEIEDLSEENEDEAIKFIRDKKGICEVDDFVKAFSDEKMNELLKDGDIFYKKPSVIEVLE